MILLLSGFFWAASWDAAYGQGVRVGGTGGRSSGGWFQARPQGDSTRQSFRQGTPPGQEQRGGWARAYSYHPRVRGKWVFVASPGWGIVYPHPPYVYRSAPLRYYPYLPYFYYPRLPGALMINVPNYGPPVSPGMPYAPGVDSAAPRPTEDPAGEIRGRSPGRIAPFDPTPMEVVERMLALASVNSSDRLYDLGSGDGRVVIAAAKRFGATAVGFETDPGLVKLARENAQKEGVEHLVEFRQQDLLTAELSDATVVTLYLSHDGNLALRARLQQQLRTGARVVSYRFDMGDWASRITESYRDRDGNLHLLYFWQIGDQ